MIIDSPKLLLTSRLVSQLKKKQFLSKDFDDHDVMMLCQYLPTLNTK